MLRLAICLAIASCAAEMSSAQDSSADLQAEATDQSYVVQLTEYRLEAPIDPSL